MATPISSFCFAILIIVLYLSINHWDCVEAQGNSNSAAAFPWWWWSLYVTFNNNPCRTNAARRSCNTCIHRSPTCYWCSFDNTCRTLPRGRTVPFPGDCANDAWHRTQCIISGNVLLIVVPCAIAAVIIFIACILYCCCCRYRKKDRIQKDIRENQEQQNQHVQELIEEQVGHAQLREDIRRKYGITKNTTSHSSQSNYSRSSNGGREPYRASLERSSRKKMNLAKYSRLKNIDDSMV